jgi:hypothetical protein
LHKTEQDGGLSSVAYAPPRCNRRKAKAKVYKYSYRKHKFKALTS